MPDNSGDYSRIAAAVEAGVRKVQNESMAMARQVSARFRQVAEFNTGRCQQLDGQESTNMELPKAHKVLFDHLRRQKPDTYTELANLAERFNGMTPAEQFEFLEKAVVGK